MISKNEIEKAILLLEKDAARNISFVNFIKNYKVNFLEVINDVVVAKGISDHEWIYVSCKSKDELKALLPHVKENEYFAVLEEWMVPIIADGKELEWELKTRRYILPDSIEIFLQNDISPLSGSDAEYIYEVSKYKDFLSVEYIEERIARGISCAIRKDDKLVAWAITQDDDAIGFLNVLNEYRRQGLARKVMQSMISQVRKQGKIPFAYVEDANERASALCRKLGFKPDRLISWIKLK